MTSTYPEKSGFLSCMCSCLRGCSESPTVERFPGAREVCRPCHSPALSFDTGLRDRPPSGEWARRLPGLLICISHEDVVCIPSFLPLRPSRRECARTKTRSRLCGAPTSRALNRSHSASYPRSARSPRILPNSRPEWQDSSPRTFSRNIHWGATSQTIRSMSGQSHLSSLDPFLLPAVLNGGQGNPAVTRSTFPRQRLPSKVPMSSQIGARSKNESSIRATRTDAE